MASKKAQRHIIASIGTILFMLMVMLILLFVYLRSQKPEIEEGVELAFGDVGEMIQDIPMSSSSEASSAASSEPVEPASQPVTQPSQPSAEPILSDEETLAMQREKAKQDSIAAAEQQRRAKELAEQKERERKAEEARKEAERKAAEEKAKQDQAIANAQGMAGLFPKGGNGTGNGDGKNTSGANGSNPITQGSNGGGGNDPRIQGLKGRKPRDGQLPEPTCEFKDYGVVAVKIRVDAKGNTTIIGDPATTPGTNTSDKNMIQCAKDAISKTKWTEGTSDGEGIITYTFTPR